MKVLAWDIGTRTLSYCAVTINEDDLSVTVDPHQWGIIDLITEEMSDIPEKSHTMEQFNIALIKAVKKRDYVYGTLFDEVVIEQQPAGGHNKFACVTMKILSHALYTWYLLEHTPPSLGFISPALKIQELTALRKTRDLEQTPAQRYRENKLFSVEKTIQILGSDALNRVATSKKKDDLCDAFMLAYERAKAIVLLKRKQEEKLEKQRLKEMVKLEKAKLKEQQKLLKAQAKQSTTNRIRTRTKATAPIAKKKKRTHDYLMQQHDAPIAEPKNNTQEHILNRTKHNDTISDGEDSDCVTII